jgi:hypothetical protein
LAKRRSALDELLGIGSGHNSRETWDKSWRVA